MPINVNDLVLTRGAPLSLARQLYQQLSTQILSGDCLYHEKLPSSRALATQLKLSRGVVTEVYDSLQANGLVASFGKGGTKVTHRVPQIACKTTHASSMQLTQANISARGSRLSRAKPYRPTGAISASTVSTSAARANTANLAEHVAEGIKAMTPGVPDWRLFPWEAWHRLRRDAESRVAKWYQAPGGDRQLRSAIARYLVDYRGMHDIKPEQVMITTGSQASLSFISRLLTNAGDVACVDTPGWRGSVAAMQQAGLDTVQRQLVIDTALSVANDTPAQIECPAGVPAADLYVSSPALLYPMGQPQPMQLTTKLFAAIRQHQAWLLEDDYAAEFSLGQFPSPSIWSQARSAGIPMVHLGTFSKLLFPGLRIGWMVLPDQISQDCAEAMNVTGIEPPYWLQAQLAAFLEAGHLSRHLTAIRSEYAARFELMQVWLRSSDNPCFEATGSISGMNVFWRLHHKYMQHQTQIEQQLGALGYGIEWHCTMLDDHVSHYALIGYSAYTTDELRELLSQLAKNLAKIIRGLR